MVGSLFGGRPGGGGAQVGIADDGEIVAELLERLERLSELEIGARLRWRPIMFICAVGRAAGGSVDHLDAG